MSEERLVVAAEPRTITGKKVKQLRRVGIVPAVIYGKNEPDSIQLDRKQLRRVLKIASTSQLVDVEISGEKRTVLAREIQQHVTRGDIMHVDFFEVDMKSTITAEASLILIGKSSEALAGLGSVVLAAQSVEIECLPGDLISEIEVDMTGIESPDDVIYVADLPSFEGVTVLTDPEVTVARFQYAQTEEAAEAEEEDFTSVEDVEVIGAGAEDEEGDE